MTIALPPPHADPLIASLLKIALFHGLDEGQLSKLASNAERCMFASGDVITSAGQAADAAYLIVGGPAWHVAEEAGHEPQIIAPGSLIGEMGMLIEHTYGATVVARGAVRALRLKRSMLHALMLADPRLAEHLMHRVAERLVHVASELRRIDRLIAEAASRPTPHQRPEHALVTVPRSAH